MCVCVCVHAARCAVCRVSQLEGKKDKEHESISEIPLTTS